MKKIALVLIPVISLFCMAGMFGYWGAYDSDTIEPKGARKSIRVTSAVIGTPNSTEGGEEAVWEAKVESDTGVESVGGSMTAKLDDETNDTEDISMFLYRMEAGALCVAHFYGAPLSAAPTWAPCTGCRIISDGTGAAPFDAAGGLYWNGSAWAAD